MERDAVGFFDIYKRSQGKYTRTITLVSVIVLAMWGAWGLSQKFLGYAMTRPPLVRYGVPTLLVAAMAVLGFWIVNRPRSADFMIATESEMKKVSWSSRREIAGSTKVVILTTVILAALLFGVDMLFALIFRSIGLMG
jgi:preprotein translocase subunit SecE